MDYHRPNSKWTWHCCYVKIFVTVSNVNIFDLYREKETLLWRIQWRLSSMKLLKKWEKMVNLTHKCTLESSMIMLKSKGKMLFQGHSQLKLKKLNIPNKLSRKIWFIRLPINSTAQRSLKERTCQQNSSHVQNLSQVLSMEATSSTLGLILSKHLVDSTRAKTNEQIFTSYRICKNNCTS